MKKSHGKSFLKFVMLLSAVCFTLTSFPQKVMANFATDWQNFQLKVVNKQNSGGLFWGDVQWGGITTTNSVLNAMWSDTYDNIWHLGNLPDGDLTTINAKYKLYSVVNQTTRQVFMVMAAQDLGGGNTVPESYMSGVQNLDTGYSVNRVAQDTYNKQKVVNGNRAVMIKNFQGRTIVKNSSGNERIMRFEMGQVGVFSNNNWVMPQYKSIVYEAP